MDFNDPRRSTQHIVDASPVSLSAVLSQKNRKGKTEKKTEKEALAAVWGCEYFHVYLNRSQTAGSNL